MLILKPNCELCDTDLPANSTDACICSYECTFCTSCVKDILHNVCPNCGGGFVPRPIRPQKEHRAGVNILHAPAATTRVHSKFERSEIKIFVDKIKDIPPEQR